MEINPIGMHINLKYGRSINEDHLVWWIFHLWIHRFSHFINLHFRFWIILLISVLLSFFLFAEDGMAAIWALFGLCSPHNIFRERHIIADGANNSFKANTTKCHLHIWFSFDENIFNYIGFVYGDECHSQIEDHAEQEPNTIIVTAHGACFAQTP